MMAGKGKRYTERLIKMIRDENPQAVIREGTRHWRVYGPDGRLAGILPYQQRCEGISPNLIAQFRAAGITIGKGRP
jgi:hypothetical protein